MSEETLETVSYKLLPTAREKLAAEGLGFPYESICFPAHTEQSPVDVLRHLTGGELPTLRLGDFRP